MFSILFFTINPPIKIKTSEQYLFSELRRTGLPARDEDPAQPLPPRRGAAGARGGAAAIFYLLGLSLKQAVESTIYNMDTQRDGEIRFADFVKGVKDHATFKVSR